MEIWEYSTSSYCTWDKALVPVSLARKLKDYHVLYFLRTELCTFFLRTDHHSSIPVAGIFNSKLQWSNPFLWIPTNRNNTSSSNPTSVPVPYTTRLAPSGTAGKEKGSTLSSSPPPERSMFLIGIPGTVGFPSYHTRLQQPPPNRSLSTDIEAIRLTARSEEWEN